LTLGLVVVRNLGENVGFRLTIRSHSSCIVFLLCDRILFVHGLERLVQLAAVRGYYRHAEERGPEFAVVAGVVRNFLQFGGRFVWLAEVHLIRANPEVRRREMRIDRKGLAILRDRIVESAHL
jgi:hypothetical protein